MIDPHVHLRDWEQKDKETVLHGMRVAASAGFTDLFDMPNTSPVCTTEAQVLARLELGREASRLTGVRYHLYGGTTNDPDQVRAMADLYKRYFPEVVAIKLFAGHSTGNMGIIGVENQRKVFETLADAGYKGVLAVHAEKEELLKGELYVPGRFETWTEARPCQAETESVRDLISLAVETGFEGTLHICHVSAASTIELVRQNKGRLKLTMGATPHHALLSRSDAAEHGRMLKMNPPLRQGDNHKAVFNALLDGTIDWAESDHAPHTLQDKERGASGIPGLPGMLLLLSRLRGAGCGKERLERLFGKNAASAFGIEYTAKPLPEDPQSLYEELSKEYPFNPYAAMM